VEPLLGRTSWHGWEPMGGELDLVGDARGLVVGPGPAGRLASAATVDMAPLVGRHALGPLGAA
jgi:hypothetical protein